MTRCWESAASLLTLVTALSVSSCGNSGGGGPISGICPDPAANPCTSCIEVRCDAPAQSCMEHAGSGYRGACGSWGSCLCSCGSDSGCLQSCQSERSSDCNRCIAQSGLAVCILMRCYDLCSVS